MALASEQDEGQLVTGAATTAPTISADCRRAAVGVIDDAFVIATGIGLWFATANPFRG